MRIVAKDWLTPQIVRLVIKTPTIAAKVQAGQFVVAHLNERTERIPLTIADYDRKQGTISLIIQTVDKNTDLINQLQVGQSFQDILGPLGTAYPVRKVGTVAGVAMELGAASLYPNLKALSEAGNRVIGIVGARRRESLILMQEFPAICDQFWVATEDGSLGRRGWVMDLLRQVLDEEKVDEVIVMGSFSMMEACVNITRMHGVKTMVSLNGTGMDSSGMCDRCRVDVGGETKFCCVDGPIFDGLAIDFAKLRQRRSQEINPGLGFTNPPSSGGKDVMETKSE